MGDRGFSMEHSRTEVTHRNRTANSVALSVFNPRGFTAAAFVAALVFASACGDASLAAPQSPTGPFCDGICGVGDATACPSDCEALPTGGVGGVGAAGGSGGAGGIALLPGECWTLVDCDAENVCVPPDFDGIHGEITDVPGLCAPVPFIRSMGIIGLSPVRFTDDGFALEPAAVYDVTIAGTTFLWQTRSLSKEWDMVALPDETPFESTAFSSAFSFAFDVAVVAVDVADPDSTFDVQCGLVFTGEGELTGGSLRGPGNALCSTTNQQYAGDPGLLVEFEYYCQQNAECPAYAPFCSGLRCVSEVPEP